jgi:VIT1/CCC1 family predicted Fe2+/Mn2+ transporter
MAQIKNINDAPIINPDGSFLVALKNGQLSRIDGRILSQDSEVTAYVDAKVEEVTKSYKEEIANLNKEIIEIKAIINGMALAAQNTAAEVETEEDEVEAEAPKTKSKKSKK